MALDSGELIPSSERDAARMLEAIITKTPKEIRALSGKEFCRAWNSVFFLYPGLHPDDDHGKEVEKEIPDNYLTAEFDSRVFTPHYARSGWPLHLVPLHMEALRRVRRNELKDEEFYPSRAQAAGIQWRETNLAPIRLS